MSDGLVEQPGADAGTVPSAGGGGLGIISIIAAAAVVAVYLVFLGLQWRNTGAADTVWARKQALLSGIQALAFSGLGALLGSAVQSKSTRKAEAQARRSEQVAKANTRDAEKGRALQHDIAARVAGTGRDQRDPTRGAGPDRAMSELAELARRYDIG